MISIPDLWLPIVVSAAFVFVVSSILHMVLTYHRADYRKLPMEDEVAEAIRRAGPGPGQYVFPYCSSAKEMGTPEMKEKLTRGPVGILTVRPSGLPNMGAHLGTWFGFCVLVSLFVAYLAGRTLASGAEYLAVFRLVGTVAFMGYAFGDFVDSIWKSQPWSNTFRAAFDGLVYALVTAGTFGWLWPR